MTWIAQGASLDTAHASPSSVSRDVAEDTLHRFKAHHLGGDSPARTRELDIFLALALPAILQTAGDIRQAASLGLV
jgi:hypothetical protein